MYEELVVRLRERASWIGFSVHHGESKNEDAEMMKEAADAIEELDKLLDGVCADNDSLCETIEELKKKVEKEKAFAECWEEMAQDCKARFQKLLDAYPRWISVEERLPEENGRYLVRYKRDIVLDYTEVHDDEVRIMRFFVGDGWRYPFLCQPELRKAEQQIVTHWMALPNLPAEENANG